LYWRSLSKSGVLQEGAEEVEFQLQFHDAWQKWRVAGLRLRNVELCRECLAEG
jgi:hypothetical protein